MLLAGPSKAGKSFALIEMTIAIAEGKSWFGWRCAQGRVLYVNLGWTGQAACIVSAMSMKRWTGNPKILATSTSGTCAAALYRWISLRRGSSAEP